MADSAPCSLRLSRILLSIATVLYGTLPVLADLTETHAYHPDWPPHARMHMVWFLCTNGAMAVLALYLMWVSRIEVATRTRIAGVIGLCSLGGFFVSAATAKTYGGALMDPVGGVPPINGVDANLVAFIPITVFVIVGLLLAMRRSTDA